MQPSDDDDDDVELQEGWCIFQPVLAKCWCQHCRADVIGLRRNPPEDPGFMGHD